MNEQQSGVVVPPVADTPKLTIEEALIVMSCTQILGKRHYNDLKRAASDVIDEAAKPIVAKWPDRG